MTDSGLGNYRVNQMLSLEPFFGKLMRCTFLEQVFSSTSWLISGTRDLIIQWFVSKVFSYFPKLNGEIKWMVWDINKQLLGSSLCKMIWILFELKVSKIDEARFAMGSMFDIFRYPVLLFSCSPVLHCPVLSFTIISWCQLWVTVTSPQPPLDLQKNIG